VNGDGPPSMRDMLTRADPSELKTIRCMVLILLGDLTRERRCSTPSLDDIQVMRDLLDVAEAAHHLANGLRPPWRPE